MRPHCSRIREAHTATLLNGPGDVLVTDGSSSEVYNPYTNFWRRTASLTTGRYSHTATELPSGKVLVAGGRTCDWSTLLSSAELYDPATDTWSPTGSLFTPRSHHTAVAARLGQGAGGGRQLHPLGDDSPPGDV